MPCYCFSSMENFEAEKSRLVRVTLQVDKACSVLPKGVRPLDHDVKQSVNGDMRVAALIPTYQRGFQSIGESKGLNAQVLSVRRKIAAFCGNHANVAGRCASRSRNSFRFFHCF
ncbi:hypothetical protein AFUB_050590 [Aspergillus fumigatus A1163]|uniref:Uncharacterized protein n=1 Tax=Aspergillus fumigatus (strain CBS 144.89 / FGSC A1163 / CEA10) TaxID=451804 RepID=B0Y217_ASPFC|nr:hypothetical protein AFUB_050590 [Aspergillus fumigatus A1163]